MKNLLLTLWKLPRTFPSVRDKNRIIPYNKLWEFYFVLSRFLSYTDKINFRFSHSRRKSVKWRFANDATTFLLRFLFSAHMHGTAWIRNSIAASYGRDVADAEMCLEGFKHYAQSLMPEVTWKHLSIFASWYRTMPFGTVSHHYITSFSLPLAASCANSSSKLKWIANYLRSSSIDKYMCIFPLVQYCKTH